MNHPVICSNIRRLTSAATCAAKYLSFVTWFSDS